ncbi:hypothetical protein M9H77_22553 [Catharanthus roseus]|uniref:Uncharacterized protein n=1 Tax=Catharanthus roseus TaxID=4058 RepID=A0ACC0ASI4_CATRO|nr:hypothetical protein M9H77_22553 [Catharanthus roseus]
MNSTKRDKSYWEHVSIAHRKIGKSSGSGSRSGSRSDSGFGSSARVRGRSPRATRDRGRRRSNGRSSLSSVINPDTPSTPFPYIDAFPDFVYEFIQDWKNVIVMGRPLSYLLNRIWIALLERYASDSFRNNNISYRSVNGSRPSGYSQTQTQTVIVKHGPRPRLIPSGYKIYGPRPDPPGSRVRPASLYRTIGCAGMRCLNLNCLTTLSGMYASTQSKYAMKLCHMETQTSRIS